VLPAAPDTSEPAACMPGYNRLRDRLRSKNRLQFEIVNKSILMLTRAIPDNGL